MIKKYLRKRFIGWLKADLFKTIELEEILAFLPGGIVRYRGKKLSDEQVVKLLEDAERFSQSVIWKMLSEDARYNAATMMFEKSKSFEEMMFGKAVLYCVDILNKRLEQLSNLKK